MAMTELPFDLYKKEEIYQKFLEKINSKNFTIREIDVIACILNNRCVQNTASLLSISPKTVSAHLYNIRQKFDSRTKEYILDFIEKSEKLKYLNLYYYHLRINGEFRKKLLEIGSRTKGKNICYYFFYEEENKNDKFLEHLENDLNIANITLLKNEKDTTLDKNISTNLHIIRKNTTKINREFSSNDIILWLNKETNLFLDTDSKYIDFRKNNNYYFSVLSLLEMMIEDDELIKITGEFKNILKDLQTKTSFNSDPVKESYLEQEKNKNSNTSSIETKQIIPETLNKDKNLVEVFLSKFIINNQQISKKRYLIIFTLIGSILLLNTLSDNTQQQQTKTIKLEPWNLPQYLEHYTDRDHIISAIWDKFKNDDNNRKIAILTGLHGLGGVGKTLLATNAIHNPRQQYDFRGWFSSETKELLQADYFQLGEKYQLFATDMSTQQKILLVRDWLNRQNKALLIYDNTPDMEALEEFLPSKGHIIITSRNFKLPGAIEIDVMIEQEAIALLDKLLPERLKKMEGYTVASKELANKLGYLPLALSQAGAYIAANSLTIQEYLILYNTEKDKLLADKTMPAMDKHQAAYITWDISLKKIQQHDAKKNSLLLLDFIAYCHPENIPKKLLAQHLFDKADNEAIVKLNTILSILREYSLIKITSSDNISLHRLVHSWLRTKHSKDKKLKIFKKIISGIEKISHWKRATSKDINFVKSLLPHMEAILSQIRLYKNDPKINLFITQLTNRMGLIYRNFGDLSRSLKYYQDSLEAQKKLPNDPTSNNTANILNEIGHIYTLLGQLDESIKCFKQAIEIEKLLGNRISINIANSERNLGVAYYRKGEIKKSLRYFEQSLNMGNKIYSNGVNEEIALNMSNLSLVHCKLGNIEKASQYSKKSLSIYQKLGDKSTRYFPFALQIAGLISYYKGDLEKSLNYSQKALEMRKKLIEAKPYPYIAEILNNIGMIYYKQGDFIKSLDYFEQALEMYDNLLITEIRLGAALLLNNIGDAYIKIDQIEKGLKYSEKSLKIYNNLLKDKIHPELAHTLNSLGIAYYKLGSKLKSQEHIKKAINYFKNAHKMRLEWYENKNHPYIVDSSNKLYLTQAYEQLRHFNSVPNIKKKE